MVELSPEAEAGDAPLFRQGFAGDTLNTAWYLRALLPETCQVRFVTAVGKDAVSSRMLAFLSANGIDTSSIAELPDRTVGLYMISLSAGERRFTYWRSQSAAKALADDPDRLEQALAGCRLAYLSGITLAILPDHARATLLKVLARFRANGGLVAFDSNIRPVLWQDAAAMRTWITKGYATCDLAFPTYEDEAALFSDDSPQACAHRIAKLGAREIVVKDGPDPVLLLSEGKQTLISTPRVAKPVDTTAAGDSFNAGWLAAWLGGASATAAVTKGQILATRVICHKGALIPMGQLS
ncbi:MAG: sugar kinase [Proteobacteria bacterium]|nr:MAG: sugar kinase [Pseudomonadota bacterium]